MFAVQSCSSDIVVFQRIQGAKSDVDKWHPGSRIIGFDGSKVIWGLCEGVPVCVATDKVRPANPAETTAYLMMNHGKPNVDYTAPRDDTQEKFANYTKDDDEEDIEDEFLYDDGERTDVMAEIPEDNQSAENARSLEIDNIFAEAVSPSIF